MSEYGLSSTQHRGNQPAQYMAQTAPNVEWYSPAGQQQYATYGGYDNSYQSSGGGGGAYGSFEDEAPLLEGTRVC